MDIPKKQVNERLQLKKAELDKVINQINAVAQMRNELEQKAVNLALQKRGLEDTIQELEGLLGIKKEAKTKRTI